VFSEVLTNQRNSKGISQRQLAELSNVHIATIRNYEQGLREPTFANVCRIARALGVSVLEFVPPDDSPAPEPPVKRPRGRPKKVK
jgi:transcriptional regulator with XRE-family HTH domain